MNDNLTKAVHFKVLRALADLNKISKASQFDFKHFFERSRIFQSNPDELKDFDFGYYYRNSRSVYTHLTKVYGLIMEFYPEVNDKFPELINFVDSLNNQIRLIYSINDHYDFYGDSKNVSFEVQNNIFNNCGQVVIFIQDNLQPFIDLLTKIESYFNKISNIKHFQISKNQDYLYHATKVNIALEILNRGSILGYTSHRYWNKGVRYQTDDPEYQKSFWMKGISMTRNVDYALSWNAVTFVFDKNVIEYRHKIQCYDWFHHREDSPKVKVESEEFIVLKKTGKTFKNEENMEFLQEYKELVDGYNQLPDQEKTEDIQDMISSYEKRKHYMDLRALNKPEGEFKFSYKNTNALIGFFLHSEHIQFTDTCENSEFYSLMNHPNFLGFLK